MIPVSECVDLPDTHCLLSPLCYEHGHELELVEKASFERGGERRNGGTATGDSIHRDSGPPRRDLYSIAQPVSLSLSALRIMSYGFARPAGGIESDDLGLFGPE